MTFQQFINHLLKNWLPDALKIQKVGKNIDCGYVVESERLLHFMIGNQACLLGKESSATALNKFAQHMKQRPNPTIVIGTVLKPNVPCNIQTKATVWFEDPAPIGVNSKEGFWRMTNVWIRPVI